MSKPQILILGGCGFIGRHLVEYLVMQDVAAAIRVVDKTPPQMAWLNEDHLSIFKHPCVEFCSANLINLASCKNAFALHNDKKWDFVINCAAETRPGQSDPVYQEGIQKLSLNCANESIAMGVQRYIELSSANMCSTNKTPHKEDSLMEPWTWVGKHKAKVESTLAKLNELNYTICRLPLVYGKGDKRGLTPRIIIASLYKYLDEPMKLLWDSAMKLNTVHVSDVVAAIWELANNPKAVRETYNIADNSDSTQGSISDILADIFNIKVDYWGIMLSSLTKVNMTDVIEEINDKHMGPWAEVCQIDHVENTPLTPYMDEELLYHKHLYVDNTKLKATGYVLRVPTVTTDKIEEILFDYVHCGLFPQSLALNN